MSFGPSGKIDGADEADETDGNGRTGRALIVWSCLQHELTPIVIEKEQRSEYMAALNQKDIKRLTLLAQQIQKKEIERKAVFDGIKKDDEKRSYVTQKNKKFSIER